MNPVLCVFCTNHAIKERVITENDHALVFPTNIPIVPGHVLICPKRHVQYYDDLTPEELLVIQSLITTLKTALIKTFDATGFNYAWNEGVLAGQSVPHLHLHMLPRKEGDTGITAYEPRQFLYRPGSREASPEEELRAVANIIREAL